jgi:release factor glutamine methyltransferase
MRQFLKKIAHRPLKFIASIYLKKGRTYASRGLKLQIEASVFHPGLYLSTNILADFALALSLRDKQVLELGAGSGFISLLLAREGANVTSSDVNTVAIATLQQNAQANGLQVQGLHSDLFTALDPNTFECILINPPYYPQHASNSTEAAFFCGENFEYFQRLFSQLQEKLQRTDTQIYMILSEDCRLDEIREIGQNHGFEFHQVLEKRKRGEWNYIFSIRRVSK